MASFAWLLLVAAGPREETSVPYPELGSAEPLVREALLSARDRHDALVAGGTADAAALAESYGTLGELYHAYDLVEAAEAAYAGALRLVPREHSWLYLLGFLQQTEGRREESVETLRKALTVEAEDIPTLLRLADQELELGQVDSAERSYRRVLELQPSAAAALQGLGRVETVRGRHEASVAAYEQALAVAPYASRLHFLAAMAYRRTGDLERAQYHFGLQGPVEVGFDDPLAVRMQARATGSAATRLRGFMAQSAGSPEQAITAYRRAVAADPNSSEARRALAGALRQTGDLAAAIEQYRDLLRIDSNPAAAHFALGGVLQESGAPDEALTHFKAAVEIEPEYRMFRFRLAGALAEAGDVIGAETQFRRLIELDGRDVSARLRLGELLAETGRDSEALEHFRTVIGSDASRSLHAVAYDGQGRVLARNEAIPAAIESFEKALEIDSGLVTTRFALGNLRGRMGDFSAAAAEHRTVVELVPQHTPARLGEATALLLAGREEEALRRLEDGQRAMPGNPEIVNALARLLASSSEPRLRDGVRSLRIALELYTKSGALEHGETVAMALAELERFEEAIDWQINLLAEAERQQDSAL
ncbi:MAG: tetratricopeptide repeat protein, partial [bacterium]|nr:tetratricopeptide repeat protein [bacterium]